ncbi:nuclear transport factor 2 family protein [Flavihumibacter rivuli]|uniref:nuclear transport factor 2 family protein n=1 Tax=Flavihumibacter rivuli TaxID=2838156 RepID=UPI001BDEDFAC|nr:nuclear transport factor 2 family protein [Flavihumibacter rivuli]ULQ57154.1 nuclear transport factor 2 family protein [Flavihumibacter rivuli]
MMEPVQVIEALYRYFAAKDEPGLLQLLDAAVQWKQMDGFPGSGSYSSADEVIKKVFRRLQTEWLDWKAVVTNFHAAGSHVFVEGYYSGTYAPTGKSMQADFLHSYDVKEGKVVAFRQYTDTWLVVRAMMG